MRVVLCLLGLLSVSACSLLRPAALPDPVALYALEQPRGAAPAVRPPPVTAPTLLVSLPQPAAGFDSSRMIYVRQPHRLEHFARNEWVDTPVRMLLPLLVVALASGETFAAVVPAHSSVAGALRLDTDSVVLQQEFGAGASRVRFALRAQVVDPSSRQVIAAQAFEALAPAPSEGPYGGVLAANAAVQSVLGQLAQFCAEAAQRWQARRVQERPKFMVQ